LRILLGSSEEQVEAVNAYGFLINLLGKYEEKELDGKITWIGRQTGLAQDCIEL
jgi:hypothetical protein